jgi:hypothetical protein
MRLALAFLTLSLVPATVRAAGQGETAVTGGPGLAILFDGETRVGGAADLQLLHGLSDFWSARLGLQAAWLPSRDETSATRLVMPGLGLMVAADVLNLVPFAALGVVLADIRGGGVSSRQRLAGQLSLGADYLASRHLTLSLLGRIDYPALRLAGPRTSSPLLLTFALHAAYVF